MGDHLDTAVGLIGSEDPAEPAFKGFKGEKPTKSPHILALIMPYEGVPKSPGPHAECVFVGFLSALLLLKLKPVTLI